MESAISPVRQPAVAGQFYPGSRAGLDQAVRNMTGPGPTRPALGVLVPHAGYMYSGRVAGAVYGSVDLPDTFVIMGPNHTGLGPPASVMTSGMWEMPGGGVVIDATLAAVIVSHSRLLTPDESAHAFEHSIEVQLPFLQVLVGKVKIVPICLMTTTAEQCRDVGMAIAAAVREAAGPVLVVASSDMSHYESQDVAEQKDRLALDRVLGLDPEGLIGAVHGQHISMCGFAPAAAMLYAAGELGATKADLIRYETSGDVTGDYRQVVGYAGVVVS